MNRPRTVAVVSAVAASTAGFMVASRWNLMGTFAGAILVPLVYSLVSHWSTEGLGCVGRWLRRRLGLEIEEEDPAVSAAKERAGAESRPSLERRNLISQWMLAGFSLLALAVSVYAVVVPGPVRTVVVQERVVEKTVTVTTGSDTADTETQLVASVAGGAETGAAAAAGNDTAQDQSDGDATTETTQVGLTQGDQPGAGEPPAEETDATDTTGGETGETVIDPATSGSVPEQQGVDASTGEQIVDPLSGGAEQFSDAPDQMIQETEPATPGSAPGTEDPATDTTHPVPADPSDAPSSTTLSF